MRRDEPGLNCVSLYEVVLTGDLWVIKMRLNTVILSSGIAAMILAAVWTYFIAPTLLRPDSGYAVRLVYEAEGDTRISPNSPMVHSRFSEDHKTRTIEVNGPHIIFEISTRFTDLVNGEILFDDVSRVPFNRSTMKMDGSETLAFFPHHLEQTDYIVKQFTYFPDGGVPFRFQEIDFIQGAEVYRFDFDVPELDWTNSYDYTLEPNVRIVARDWGSVWVEPSTGIVVKHTENWIAEITGGRYDGAKVDVGHMWLSPDTIAKQAFVAQNERRTHMLYELVIPVLLTLIGLTLVVMSFRKKKEA